MSPRIAGGSFISKAPTTSQYYLDLKQDADYDAQIEKRAEAIVYALMQATGMVNDHLVSCPRHAELTSLAESFERHGAK